MIIDGFTFYNEFDILKKRLRYLSPVIDKFVLVESTVTHRGEPKELLFEKNREMFSEWLDKIIHIVVCDNPDGDDPWKRENHQRNCIVRGLEGIQDDALVMVSDVDEIPHRDFIQLPLDVDMCSFNMTAFQYSFKFIQQQEPWFGTVLTRKSFLTKVTPQQLRDNRWRVPFYKNAGWHLSSFGNEEFVANKIYNFAHCHDESSQNKNVDVFKQYIEQGLMTDGKYKLVETTSELYESLPTEIKI